MRSRVSDRSKYAGMQHSKYSKSQGAQRKRKAIPVEPLRRKPSPHKSRGVASASSRPQTDKRYALRNDIPPSRKKINFR